MTKLTSGMLARWALAGAATTFIMTLGMLYLFAEAEPNQSLEQYTGAILFLLYSLGLTASWYYTNLRHRVGDTGDASMPPFDHAPVRRRAILSSLAAIEIAFSMLGVALLRTGRAAEGFVCLGIGLLVLLVLFWFVIRQYRHSRAAPGPPDDEFLKSAFAFSMVVSLSLVYMVLGLIGLSFIRMSLALAWVGGGIVLALYNINSLVDMVRKREEQLPREQQVLSMATAIFGLATLALASFITCCVFFLSLRMPAYGAGALLACAISLYLLFRQTRKAEERIGITSS